MIFDSEWANIFSYIIQCVKCKSVAAKVLGEQCLMSVLGIFSR